MLSAAAWDLAAAAAGLGGALVGGGSGLALLGLLAAALFLMVLGACGPTAEATPVALAEGSIGRPAALCCAAALGLIAALAGSLALLIWTAQGPGPALGLLALALACALGALAFGGVALRRR